MLQRTGNTWERMAIALRVIPALPTGRNLGLDRMLDAGWLVKQGAHVAAIGIAIGQLANDGDELRVRVLEINAAQVHSTKDIANSVSESSIDREAFLLETAAGQISMLNSPLVVTCGGRKMDLPFVRYRCLAKGVGLDALHLSFGNRLSYFDRYDLNWHLDLCDLLSTQGASSALALDDLCSLCGVEHFALRAGPDGQAHHGATSVFALFLSVLRMMGRLSMSEHNRAMVALSEAAHGASLRP